MNTITVIENARSKSRHAFLSTERYTSQQLAKYFVAIFNYEALQHNKKFDNIIAKRKDAKDSFKASITLDGVQFSEKDGIRFSELNKKLGKLNSAFNLISGISQSTCDAITLEKTALLEEIEKFNIKKVNHDIRKALVEEFDEQWVLKNLSESELKIYDRGKLKVDHFNYIAVDVPCHNVLIENIDMVLEAGITVK